MRTSRTPLMSALRKAWQMSLFGEANNLSNDELLAMKEEVNASRRKFLKTTAKAGLVLGVGSAMGPLLSCKKNDSHSKTNIVIVGGGVSGLNAAYQLKKKGIIAPIYEADKRTGGRMNTKANHLAQGITTEVGAEFIDTNHEDMINLANEFGLTLVDTELDTFGEKVTYFIDGVKYSLSQVIDEFRKVAGKIMADQDSIDEDYSNDATIALDNTPLNEYLQSFSALGAAAWFIKMLDFAYLAEFGLETKDQSSLNFVDFITAEVLEDKFKIFGDSDERYKIEGGNHRVCEELAKRVKDQIHLEKKLSAIKQVENGKYELTFGAEKVFADIVIMTLPFSILRHIEMDVEDLSDEKKQCINELGYGTNSKVMFGFSGRAWRDKGSQGYLYNEGIQNGWDHGHMQNNNQGNTGYTVFLGGDAGLESMNLSEQQLKDKYLPQLETIYPGSTAYFNGTIKVARWITNPFVKASYASYKVGQWTTISGLEIESVGNIIFAGEHCSSDFQGYMNGGAETGRVAAESVEALVKKE